MSPVFLRRRCGGDCMRPARRLVWRAFELRKALQMSVDFVLHSLRFTCATRLGELSGDALMDVPKGAFEGGRCLVLGSRASARKSSMGR